MSYIKAEDILPTEVVKLIQKYVDGKTIYIPRKENERKEWGSSTEIRKELMIRNQQIFVDFQEGLEISELAVKYFLSEKSIQRILYNLKKSV